MTVGLVAAGKWVRRFSSGSVPRMRLVCFAHAGGSASFFRTWHRSLGQDVEVLAIRYPGRQDRLAEPCAQSLAWLADEIAMALVGVLDDGVPFAFFGHSMGSAVAYEVAVRLEQRAGLGVSALFVSGAVPPHVYQPGSLHLAGDAEFLAALRELGAADEALFENPELQAMVLPSIRADFRLIETYRAGVDAVRAPIHVFSGDADPSVEAETMKRWAELSSAGCEYLEFEGDHFYLVEREGEVVAEVGRRLTTG